MDYAIEQGSYIPRAAVLSALLAATCSTFASGQTVNAPHPTSLKIIGDDLPYEIVGVSPVDFDKYTFADSGRSELELLVEEISNFESFGANWDGEGAAAPIPAACKAALKYLSLMTRASLPEAMLHSSGSVGLLWKEPGFYADLEFLSNSKIAYFVESEGDKHKGVVTFDQEKMPLVLASVLGR